MNSHWSALLSFLGTFFRFFGGLICLFLLVTALPFFGDPLHLAPVQVVLSLVSALVFTLTHTFLLAEGLDGKLSLRARCLLCCLPCALALGALVHVSGLGSLILAFHEIPDQQGATVVFWGNSLLVFALFALAYLLLQQYYLRQGRQYSTALAAYRAKHRDLSPPNCSPES